MPCGLLETLHHNLGLLCSFGWRIQDRSSAALVLTWPPGGCGFDTMKSQVGCDWLLMHSFDKFLKFFTSSCPLLKVTEIKSSPDFNVASGDASRSGCQPDDIQTSSGAVTRAASSAVPLTVCRCGRQYFHFFR